MIRFYIVTAAVTAAFVGGLFAGASTAQANRPVPGHHYKDVCHNIAGKQTILDVTGIAARYQFDASTPRKNDCVAVSRIK
jgi:hypothetical protein